MNTNELHAAILEGFILRNALPNKADGRAHVRELIATARVMRCWHAAGWSRDRSAKKGRRKGDA